MDGNPRVVQPERAITGESPLWDADRQTLWWIDIQGRRLLGWHEIEGAVAPLALPSEPGLVALADDGRLVLGLEDGLWLFDPEARRLEILTAMTLGPNIRLNDGKPDRQGRLWFGSMDKSGSGIPVGSLYCRLPDGTVRTAMERIGVPNAIAVSPDGSTFYFSDSTTRRVLAFNLDQQTGALANERVFVAFASDEKPDGTAIDEDGGVWVAVVHGARIDRYSPSGELLASVSVPVDKPTMAAFGTSDLRTIFVTSQRRFLTEEQLAARPGTGSLLAIDVGATGSRVNRVALAR